MNYETNESRKFDFEARILRARIVERQRELRVLRLRAQIAELRAQLARVNENSR